MVGSHSSLSRYPLHLLLPHCRIVALSITITSDDDSGVSHVGRQHAASDVLRP